MNSIVGPLAARPQVAIGAAASTTCRLIAVTLQRRMFVLTGIMQTIVLWRQAAAASGVQASEQDAESWPWLPSLEGQGTLTNARNNARPRMRSSPSGQAAMKSSDGRLSSIRSGGNGAGTNLASFGAGAGKVLTQQC